MTPSGLMRLCHPTDHVIPLKALTSSNRAGSPPEIKLRKVTVRALNSATWTLSSGRDLRKLDFCFTCSWLCWLTIVLHGGSRLELVRRTFIFLRVGSSSIFTPLVISSDYDFHVFTSSASKVKWPGCCCWNIHPIEVEQESLLHKTNLEKVLRIRFRLKWKLSFVFCLLQYNTKDSDGIT